MLYSNTQNELCRRGATLVPLLIVLSLCSCQRQPGQGPNGGTESQHMSQDPDYVVAQPATNPFATDPQTGLPTLSAQQLTERGKAAKSQGPASDERASTTQLLIEDLLPPTAPKQPSAEGLAKAALRSVQLKWRNEVGPVVYAYVRSLTNRDGNQFQVHLMQGIGQTQWTVTLNAQSNVVACEASMTVDAPRRRTVLPQ